MLKKILIGLAIIIAIPLIAAIFVKKDYAVEREIEINKPNEVVFDYIKHLKNQDNFSKWALMDPAMKKTYEGTDGTVGFVAAWESDNDDVGKGEQEILKIDEGQRVDYELRFFEPFESSALAYMTTNAIDSNNTKVVWGFSGSMDYPMNLMMVFMDMEKLIGDDFNEGLKKLKDELE